MDSNIQSIANQNSFWHNKPRLDVLHDSLEGGSAHRKVSTNTEQYNTEKRVHLTMLHAAFEVAIPVFDRS
jgi:hypothetical protein